MADKSKVFRNVVLPEWADERNIHVLAGIEHVAKREKGIWYVKEERCSHCGNCCMNVPKNWPHGQGEDGHCQHLKYDSGDGYVCGLKGERPYCCCVSEGEEGCAITWHRVS